MVKPVTVTVTTVRAAINSVPELVVIMISLEVGVALMPEDEKFFPSVLAQPR